MNNFVFNVKQLKLSKFIKYIWQLIISTSNATLEVPSLCPWSIFSVRVHIVLLIFLSRYISGTLLCFYSQYYSTTILIKCSSSGIFVVGPFMDIRNNAFRSSFFIVLHCLVLIRFTTIAFRSDHAFVIGTIKTKKFRKFCNHWKTNLSLETI